MMQRIKATCFEDIVAGEALCRPGVKEAQMYIDNKTSGIIPSTGMPKVDEILKPTYGAIVYQEQTMLIMHEIAVWSLGKCDMMRKVKNLEEYCADFVISGESRGYSPIHTNAIFNRFSLEYSFNKSHAVAYADNTCQTLYLANYHPVEFMSAVMSMELLASAQDSCLEAQIKQCRRMGIEILPPDINSSSEDFIPIGNTILYPLRGIKGVGEKAVNAILEEREEHGLYLDINSFIVRVPKGKCNKKVVSQLIKAGCFDSVDNINRLNLIQSYANNPNYTGLTYSQDVKRAFELETFQMYLTTHPVQNYHLFSNKQNGNVNVTALVKEIKKTTDRNGNNMAFIKFDTYLDEFDGVLFSHKIHLLNNIKIGATILINGRKDGNSLIIEGVN